jgi:hypothetical protein
MQIKDMFVKDIERQIKGVIKVGQKDDENILQELDEYVVTREIKQHLAKFYENYQRGIDGYTDKMGVWISGFFGSGKSHFLKILSYLLENREIGGKKAIDFFEDKIEDSILFNDMKRVGNVNTEVVLFNIDSKSSIDGKSKEDAILKVFMKVFYEHRGFYGDIPGVAEMEKYLTQEGQYETFKNEFKRLSGHDWVARRRTFYFDKDYVVGALTKATGMSEESAREWFDHGVNNFQISIESFAKDVKEYIDSKGNNFHLIFLVDEIGQYIGDDGKLMLNLQTLAEDLGTYCKGKVWVIVTSQESIDEISKNIKGNDFSKIQGRFDTRLSLSSISVDEVIKKRILEKKDYVGEKLEQIYHEKSAILKNVISFKDAATDLRGYQDEFEFVDVYPFIPYQFKLLQNVFEQVRKHGSSGKHLSEGERSMLSAFKESALRYKDQSEGVLVPFYAFYETIKEFLNPSISRVIDGAYNNPALKDDPFNMELLKVLFMIKYIKELPANVDNLTTLMVTNIDEDKLALKERIIKSLNLLIRETLIQKNGDVYIFLTDDEQDINREIKQIRIDEDALKKELRTYMYQHFYDDKKYRYSKQYIFDYNKKMDEKDFGNQTAHIGINVISPLSDHYDASELNVRLLSAGNGDLVIKLGGDSSYIEEMEEALRIDEYTKRKNINQLPENIQNIINSKKAEERVRRNRAKEAMEDALKNATFYINGEQIDVKGSSVKEKINNALKVLVESVYTKLSYIKEFLNKPEDLLTLLSDGNEQITLDDSINYGNELAIKEVFEFISLQDSMNKQIRVKTLHDRFSDKPYGWNHIDISGIIATLLKEQKIKLRLNGETLEPNSSGIVTALTKSSEVDRVIVTKRVKVDGALIRTAKNICRELWNKSDIADDEDGLAKDIRTLISEQVTEIKGYLSRYEGRKYPGKALLNKGLEYFREFDHLNDNALLFSKLQELEDRLLDWEEDVAYVKSFFENQKDLFDKGLNAAKLYKENELYLTDDQIKNAYSELNKVLEDYLPYGKIKNIPEYVNVIDTGITAIVTKKKKEALEQIKEDHDYLMLLSNQEGVKDNTKNAIESTYSSLKANVESYTDILKIEGVKQRSQSFRENYQKSIERDIKEYKDSLTDETNPTPPVVDPYPVDTEKISIKELMFVKTLKTESDVDTLLREIEKRLKQAIRENKNIELID